MSAFVVPRRAEGNLTPPAPEEIQCPSCGKSDWKAPSPINYAPVFGLFYCYCGNGTLEFLDPFHAVLRNAESSLMFGTGRPLVAARVRAAGKQDELRHAEWRQNAPQQFSEPPETIGMCCRCGGGVELTYSLYTDDYTHSGACTACGIHYTADVPPVERLGYKEELEKWQSEEPVLPDWIEIPYRQA